MVFVWISHKVAEATGELTKWICEVQPLTLPTISSSTASGPAETPRARGREEATLRNPSNEEAIPLVERTVAVDDNNGHEGTEKQSALTAEATQADSVPPDYPTVPGSSVDHLSAQDNLSVSFTRLPQPLSLPIRTCIILVGLWVLNLAWLFTAAYL